MKKITTLILVFSILVSCQKISDDENKKDVDAVLPTIELKIERGAFHYDTFILSDTIITYYPEIKIDSFDNADNQDYYKISTQAISKLDRDSFIQQMLDANIWNLKEKYTPEGECTSNLTITINSKGKSKKIECDDFERGCPDIIKFIESEMVRLHGKNLKRIHLPG